MDGGIQNKQCFHAACGKECLRRPKPKKKRNLIAKFSKKRQKDNRTYSALRKQFLELNPNCQGLLAGCTGQATDVHHSRGRCGNSYLDTATWVAVCRLCHSQIETQPIMAKELGLSKSRLSINQS